MFLRNAQREERQRDERINTALLEQLRLAEPPPPKRAYKKGRKGTGQPREFKTPRGSVA